MIFSNMIKTNHPDSSTILYPTPLEMVSEFSIAAFCIGGLLVGFGTKLGNGCTSGHGLSGISRFSKRSLVAVPIFFGVALLTANFLNASIIELDQTQAVYVTSDYNVSFFAGMCIGFSLAFLVFSGVFYIKSAMKVVNLSMNGN